MPEKDIRSMPAFSSTMLSPIAVSVNCLQWQKRYIKLGPRPRPTTQEQILLFCWQDVVGCGLVLVRPYRDGCWFITIVHLMSEAMRWSGLSSRPPACTR